MKTFVFYYLTFQNREYHNPIDSFDDPQPRVRRDEFGIGGVSDDPIWGARQRQSSPRTKFEVKRGSFSAESWEDACKIISTSDLNLLCVFNIYTPQSKLLVHYLDYYFATDYPTDRTEKGTFDLDPIFFYYDFYDKKFLSSKELHVEKGVDNLGYFRDYTLYQRLIKVFSDGKF